MFIAVNLGLDIVSHQVVVAHFLLPLNWFQLRTALSHCHPKAKDHFGTTAILTQAV